VTSQLINRLKYHLQTKKSLQFDEICTLVLSRQPATFSEDKKSILPPIFNVELSDHKSGITFSDQEFQSDFSNLQESIKEDLVKYNKSIVKNFGTFINTDGSISFIPDPTLNGTYNQGFKKIEHVEEVFRTYDRTDPSAIQTDTLVTKKDHLVVDSPKVPTSKKSFNFNYILYGILGLASIAGLIYLLNTIKFNVKPATKPILVITEPIANKPVIEDSIAKNVESHMDNRPSDTISMTKPIQPTEPIAEKIEINKAIVEKKTPIVVNSSIDKKTIPTKKIVNTSKKIVQENNIKKSSTLDTGLTLAKIKRKPCVVITGSFKNSTHTLKMIKSLQEKGYKVYTEEVDTMTRVGVMYDCQDPNIYDILGKIRADINASAWILK
jgi:cell division septation protein DedD